MTVFDLIEKKPPFPEVSIFALFSYWPILSFAFIPYNVLVSFNYQIRNRLAHSQFCKLYSSHVHYRLFLFNIFKSLCTFETNIVCTPLSLSLSFSPLSLSLSLSLCVSLPLSLCLSLSPSLSLSIYLSAYLSISIFLLYSFFKKMTECGDSNESCLPDRIIPLWVFMSLFLACVSGAILLFHSSNKVAEWLEPVKFKSNAGFIIFRQWECWCSFTSPRCLPMTS